MAQVVNLRFPPLLKPLSRLSTPQCINSGTFFRPIGNSDWKSLQLKLRCRGRVSALFSNKGKEERARKALEGALGGKKSEFEKWNKEIQKREEMGRGDSGGGGWFGGRGWFGGDHFWEEAQQASLVVLVLMLVYLVIAKGETLLAVVFNPMLFALRWVRNAFTYITSNILQQRISPAVSCVLPDHNTQAQEVASRLSAKERVIKKWASD